MSIVGPLPYTISDGQIIDAVPVMGNFNWLRDQINANAGVAGTTGQIQFNNGGAFGASGNLTWDGTTVGNAAGGFSSAGLVNSTQSFRAMGSTIPSSGIGTELLFNMLGGGVVAVDRTGNIYKPMYVGGSTIHFVQADAAADSAFFNADGCLLMGYAITNGASYLLQVNSQIFAANGTIATSDARVKESVSPLSGGMDAVRALKPVTFNFMQHEVHNFSACGQVGFLAQDVQQALAGTSYKDCVVVETTDLLAMNEAKLIPIAIKALQEADARISTLEALLTSLTSVSSQTPAPETPSP